LITLLSLSIPWLTISVIGNPMNVRVGLNVDVQPENGLSDGSKNGTEPEDCGLLGARCYEWDKPCCADKGLICKKHDPWCIRQRKKFCCMEDTEQPTVIPPPIDQGAENSTEEASQECAAEWEVCYSPHHERRECCDGANECIQIKQPWKKCKFFGNVEKSRQTVSTVGCCAPRDMNQGPEN